MSATSAGGVPLDLASIAASLLEQARRGGATDAVVSASEGQGLGVAVRQGRVSSRSRHATQGLTLTVYRGQRQGSAQSTDLSPERQAALVRAALDIATHTAEDPYAGPADAQFLAPADLDLDLDLNHPWALGAPAAVACAQRVEAGIASAGAEVESDGAWVSSHQGRAVLATSRGFCRMQAESSHSLSAVALARRGDARQRDHAASRQRSALDLQAPEALGAMAGGRALAALGTQPLRTQRAPVLFDARSAASLVGHFVQAASGRTLLFSHSFLRGMLGQPLFSSHVDIVEDPWQRRGLASALYDAEGVASRPRTVVDAGVLRGWFLSMATARQLGLPPTGHASGAYNLRLRSRLAQPQDGFAEMLCKLDRGLLVTGLTGDGVHWGHGDYSRGASGFWVEHGELRHAVERITLAGNLRGMFAGIQAVGNDLHTEGPVTTGSVLIDSMALAGASE